MVIFDEREHVFFKQGILQICKTQQCAMSVQSFMSFQATTKECVILAFSYRIRYASTIQYQPIDDAMELQCYYVILRKCRITAAY